MQINLNEKIVIAADRLRGLRYVSQFEEDFMPIINSAKEALTEIEVLLKKRAAERRKAGAKKVTSKAGKSV